MNAFVKDSRRNLRMLKPLTIVIGNESCDLDSAVCAIALAYFYESNSINLQCSPRSVIPVMNISRENFPLKTEVIYFMNKHGIDIDDLICSDEIPQEIYKIAKFILVDHHVAKNPLQAANVIEVIDHRPLDVNASFPPECRVILNEVGSCATLIADVIRSSVPVPGAWRNYCDLLQLLHGTIILDTLNLSASADKARPLDVEMITEIEHIIFFDTKDRKYLFNELVKARSNVDSLTTLQLLSKDLKIITNSSNVLIVAIPGFPILVQDYVQRPNAWDAFKTFERMHKCDVLVLLGIKKLEIGIRRDLAVVTLNDSLIGQKILQKLCDSESNLGLRAVEIASAESQRLNVFEQENVKASRKQILPLIKQVLNENTH